MRRAVAVIALFGATGCLATKNDFRTMQQENQALRALLESRDAARQRQIDSIARVIGNLVTSRFNTAEAAHQTDVRTQAASIASLAKTVDQLRLQNNEALTSIRNDLSTLSVKTGAVGQFTTGLQRQLEATEAATKANAEMLRRVGEALEALMRGQPTGSVLPPDTTVRGGQPEPVAGPRTLLQEGTTYLLQMSCSTGRETLNLLLQNYPTSDVAPDALLKIADSYKDCDVPGNSKKADSVYAEVVSRYKDKAPGTAAKALFRRGIIACDANDARAAKAYFTTVVKDYAKVVAAAEVIGPANERMKNGC